MAVEEIDITLCRTIMCAENTTPIMKGGKSMNKFFVAKNAKQLDICLKMLDGFDISGAFVKPKMTNNKTEYYINIDVDDALFKQLEKVYGHLIS